MNKVFVWPGNENDEFQCSMFIGDKEQALELGYIEISEEDYNRLLIHELKWDNNKQLVQS